MLALLLALSLAPAPAVGAEPVAAASSAAEAAAVEAEPSTAVPVIDHFAGGGFGEGGPAVEAVLPNVSGLAADGDGNLYVADGSYVDRLLKVSADGTVTAVANADGQPRMCGSDLCPGGLEVWESVDGLPAREAGISVMRVAAGRDGDLLVLEHPNKACSLHRIDGETGIIETLIESPHGCDYERNPVDGPIGSATLARPFSDLAVGPDGSVYFVDTRQTADENGPTGSVIRRIDPSLSVVSTVAGGGDQKMADGVAANDARLAHPYFDGCYGDTELAVDPEGRLHFSCAVPEIPYRDGIWRVEESGVLRLVAGGGKCCERRDGVDAVGSYFNGITGMVFVGAGGPHTPGLYIADGAMIRRVSPDGKAYIFSDDGDDNDMAGRGKMAVDSAGRLFAVGGTEVGDEVQLGRQGSLLYSSLRRVYELDPDGMDTPAVGNNLVDYYGEDGTPATEAGFGRRHNGVTADAAGNVYVWDMGGQRAVIRRIDADTGQVTRVAGTPEIGPLEECQRGERNGPARDAVLCVTNNNPPSPGIAVDSAGNVYVTSEYKPSCRGCPGGRRSAIYRVDAQTGTIKDIWSCHDGTLPCQLGTEFLFATGVYIDGSDRVFFSQANGTVNRLDAGPDGWSATPVAHVRPDGIPVEETLGLTGDEQGRLYVANGNRVYRITPLLGTWAVPSTDVKLVAGSPINQRGFSGDGGPAAEATLYAPRDLAVDADGNLLIADQGNYRVRRVDADTGIIDTIAGNGVCCSYVHGYGAHPYGAYGGDGGPAVEASLTNPNGLALLPDGRVLISDGPRLRVVGAPGTR